MGEKNSLAETRRRTFLQSCAGLIPLLWAGSTAAVTQTERANLSASVGPKLIDADEDAGFNFPYFLYAPSSSRDRPLIVEPINSFPSDEMDDHIQVGERRVERGLSRSISDELQTPFVVPVIKDPRSDEFWSVRPQSLDTETLNIDSGRYARLDQQILNMVDDARDRLTGHGVDTPPEFIMNGFSQTGNFANNFAAIHPERVHSVTAGGLNGMALLPRERAQGERIEFQIGTADLEDLVDEAFDETAWRNIPQLCYIGADERAPTDDTIPWRDVWSDEQARQAVSVYGENMQHERMVYSDAVYREHEANTRFEVYDGVGHDTSDPLIIRDVLAFHKRHLDIPYVMFHRGLTDNADEFVVDVYIPGDVDNTAYVRTSINGRDVSAEPVAVRQGMANRITLPLSSTTEVGDSVVIDLSESPDGSGELHSFSREIAVGASFTRPPEPGDSSIEVAYQTANGGGQLTLSTDNGAMYWQREMRLDRLSRNDSGTTTFEFDIYDEGVPFHTGDTLVLRADPRDGPPHVLDTVTVGDSGTMTVTDGVGDVSHDEVAVSFDSPPTVDDDSIAITCAVDSSFDQEVNIRLFPDVGAGRWGIDGDWDFDSGWNDFDRVDPGETLTDEFDVPVGTFRSADSSALGSNVELRAYPGDWGSLDEFVAATNVVLSGIQFATPPEGGADTVSVDYVYPPRYDTEGELRLMVGTELVTTYANLDPGTEGTHDFDLEDDSIAMESVPADADVTVSIGPVSGETLDTANRTVLPADVAGIEFSAQPEATSTHLDVEYHLNADVDIDRFASLRLYSEHTSEWGVHLTQVTPGESVTQRIDINPDEVCVPFQLGSEVTLALVDWDDPYATLPLATATTNVARDADGRSPEQREATQSDDEDGEHDEQPDDTETSTDSSDEDDHNEQSDDIDETSTNSTESESASSAVGDSDHGDQSDDETDESPSPADEATDDVPGFSVPGAIAGLGGFGYLLTRHFSRTTENKRSQDDLE